MKCQFNLATNNELFPWTVTRVANPLQAKATQAAKDPKTAAFICNLYSLQTALNFKKSDFYQALLQVASAKLMVFERKRDREQWALKEVDKMHNFLAHTRAMFRGLAAPKALCDELKVDPEVLKTQMVESGAKEEVEEEAAKEEGGEQEEGEKEGGEEEEEGGEEEEEEAEAEEEEDFEDDDVVGDVPAAVLKKPAAKQPEEKEGEEEEESEEEEL